MSLPAYRAERAVPLLSEGFFPYLITNFEAASQRIWALMFFADIRLLEDTRRSARKVARALSYAAWRGVDTRVILSATSAEDIEVGNCTSALYLSERGVAVRWFAAPGYRSTHSKLTLIDGRISIVGSHNWTDRGVHSSVEAAVAVESTDFTNELADQFAGIWKDSQPIEVD